MSSDPTAIDLRFDPRTQRMEGVAIHGNTPFSVPYVSKITENLWTGGCTNGLILPREIEHVISLYPWEQYEVAHEFRSISLIRMYDSLDQAMEQVVDIARWVNACRKTGTTLVHCQAGLNRSGLIAATALILEGMTAEEAIALLREKRSPAVLCNKGFEEWLLNLRPGS